MLTHKIPGPLQVFSFLPWVAFWSHGGSQLTDYSHLHLGLSFAPSCKKIEMTYKVTMVRTNESRAKGLGGRAEPLKPDEGMLFVFEQPQTVTFWMKDTLIPLQLALFDEHGLLTQTFEMPVEPHPENPDKRYTGDKPSLLALELAPRTLHGAVEHKSSYLCADTAAK